MISASIYHFVMLFFKGCWIQRLFEVNRLTQTVRCRKGRAQYLKLQKALLQRIQKQQSLATEA